jgi:hypothetical protein
MPSSSFTCVKTSDLDKLAKVAQGYKKMSSARVITDAATKAGEHLKGSMQQTIKGESSLSQYHDVADALQVYESPAAWYRRAAAAVVGRRAFPRNMHVGLPESHELHGRAQEMEQIYPVTQAAMDLTRQSGDTVAKFRDALAEAVFR